MNSSLKYLIVAFFILSWALSLKAHEGPKHNFIHELNVNNRLYQICKNDLEGFSQKLGGGAYSYPSLREDINTAMISRASTGKMYFEFLTEQVPADYTANEINFFFLSDIDLNLRQPYDILVNDRPLLTFKAEATGELNTLENPGNGNTQYFLIRRDINGDGVGAFRLTIPSKMVNKGKPVKIKVQGHAKGSNSWFMLFEATDVVERLRASTSGEAAFTINQQNENLVVDAPAYFGGKTVYLISDGKKSKKVKLVRETDYSRAIIEAHPPRSSFSLMYENEEFAIDFPNRDGTILSSDIVGRYFYHFNCTDNNSWKAAINKLYRPDFFNVYSDFFDRRYENGKVAILNSSHQDIAWVDRPEVCKILRDTLLLTPILQDAFKREDYGFDIEDGLMLREYLERHPNSQKKLTELLNRKLISVGATYNCPYEDMYDAEDQVRQLYLGKRWVKDMFGGYDSKVYWNVDVPGKTLQYPQILKKAGVDYMVISRHAKGMFYWQSPDGSTVFTYSPGHYGNDIIHLSKDLGNKIKYGAEQVIHWDQYYANSINYTPLLSDQDMLPAIDYSEFIEVWNGFETVKGDDGKENQVYFPDMELMTMDEFMPLASEHATTADTIKGERPNVWIYIHGPSHHEALTASRHASKLITSAEKFLAISSLIDEDIMPYPTLDIDKAWQAKIYPDHGWGGHDGDITDNLFKAKFVEARKASEDLLNRATEFISGRVEKTRESGIPVMLFNALSWDRIDPIEVDLNLPKGRYFGLNVIDKSGKIVDSQLKNIIRFDDGSIDRVKVVFIARVPSLGYTTYYIENNETIFEPRVASFSKDNYENDFYAISLTDGGIEQIYDKKLNKDILKTNQLKGGEVFTLQSVGNGAGEFGDVQQPTMVDFDKVSDHESPWEIIDQGPVYVTYQLRQQIKDAVVKIDMTVYHELKRIFFETHLLNWSGRMYREYRTAFPVNMENAQITYEVPFGEVKVGEDEIRTAGERYVPLCKDVHPRSVIDWFTASDDEMSIVISSSVSAFDWIDPTTDRSEALLQHILLASRKSCHGEGNDYSQAGNHAYSYMLTSNSVNEVTGKRLAKQHNNPIYIEVNPEISINANLPEEMSFIRTDNQNVIISAVKKAEDNDNLIVRIYDTSGEQSQVNLKTWKDTKSIYSTDILENNPTKVLGMKVPPFSIETFMLELD